MARIARITGTKEVTPEELIRRGGVYMLESDKKKWFIKVEVGPVPVKDMLASTKDYKSVCERLMMSIPRKDLLVTDSVDVRMGSIIQEGRRVYFSLRIPADKWVAEFHDLIDEVWAPPELSAVPHQDSWVLDFGAHQNKPLSKVPASYLLWLWNEGMHANWRHCPLASYIKENLGALAQEDPDTIIEQAV